MADLTADAAIAVDEFAQTRGADDLFDDEIIPISDGTEILQQVEESPTKSQEQDQQQEQQEQQEQHPQNVATTTIPQQQPASPTIRHRGRGRGYAPADAGGRGRGRGKGGRGGRGGGGGGGGRSDVGQHTPKQEATEANVNDEVASPAPSVQEEKPSEEKKEEADEGEGEDTKAGAKAENARVQAVRGDRSGTGGVKKPKLTEEELAERMAAAKLNAAKKAAAHARAEADEASFQERERVASIKRQQELANRKVMDNERERNRLRKLGAQTGREWDAEKKEEDYNGRRGGGSQFRRGMHGAVSGVPRREHGDTPEALDDELPGSRENRGRGRGGRGRGRGRGGTGRGGGRADASVNSRPAQSHSQSAPGINSESEFPALPGGPSAKDTAPVSNISGNGSAADKPVMPALDKVMSPDMSLSPVEGSWAEQVETNESNK